MKKKRKIFRTAEERDAWFASSEANLERLYAHLEKIEAELAAKRKPAQSSLVSD